MSGWTTRKVGNVELVHHSTSSFVEIRVGSDEDPSKVLWLDYYHFEDLKRAIALTEEEKGGPGETARPPDQHA